MIKLFKKINLDITNKCILACPSCKRQLSPEYLEGSRELGLDEIQKVIDAKIKLNFCGQLSDPILHKDFLEVLRRSRNNQTTISTAGMGRSDEWWEEAFKISKTFNKELIWIFALDGLAEDSCKHRVNQDGARVWEIMKRGAELGCNILWQYIYFNYNQNDKDEASRLAAVHNMKIKFLKSRAITSDIMKHLKPDDEFCAPKDETRLRTDFTGIKMKPMCLGQKDITIINKGFMIPCCKPDDVRSYEEFKALGLYNEHLSLKNVNSLDEIFDSEEWKNFFKLLGTGDDSRIPHVCLKNCSI